MNTNSSNKPLNRAVAALQSLLTQVSAITLNGVDLAFPVTAGDLQGSAIDILAHVEVLGRVHCLACQICDAGEAQSIRTVLQELRSRIVSLPGKVTPILILPALSPEAQAICDENSAGCVDLCGNGRVAIDEVFISMRSLPRRPLRKPATATLPLRPALPAGDESAAQRVLRGFPPVHAGSARRGSLPAGHAVVR